MLWFLVVTFELDYGIRAKDFQLKNIEKLVITKYPEEQKLELRDSIKLQPIISQLLKAEKVNIYRTQPGPFLYDLKFHFINCDSIFIYSIKSPTEGKWFRLYSTNYSRDSLFVVLDQLNFDRIQRPITPSSSNSTTNRQARL